MSNVEKQLARAEAIIEALITENRLLKEKISLLENAYGSETRFVSTVKSNSGTEKDFISIVKSNYGTEIDSVSTVKSDGGTETNSESIVKSDGGTETNFVSIVKSDGGTETNFVSIVKSDGGTEKNSVSTVKSGDGSAMLTGQLPKIIDPAQYPAVASALRAAGINRVSGSYLLCVARLIIHFHNGSTSDYPSLLKLTALSRGGLSKNMASMRKRGIIRKAGFQQYEITEWSRGLLKKMVMK